MNHENKLRRIFTKHSKLHQVEFTKHQHENLPTVEIKISLNLPSKNFINSSTAFGRNVEILFIA